MDSTSPFWHRSLLIMNGFGNTHMFLRLQLDRVPMPLSVTSSRAKDICTMAQDPNKSTKYLGYQDFYVFLKIS